MYKSDRITEKIIIDGFDKNLLGVISHDLTIDKIIINSEETVQSYDLKPGETVFISCLQVVDMPINMIGIVHGRNSRIRQGLSIVSPIYQPGHKTRIFLRASNISSDIIVLNHGNSIAQISFDEATGLSDIKYSGAFQNEFNYTGLGKYDSEYITRKHNKKIEKMEDIEKRIYAGVASIIAVLIAIFGFFEIGTSIVTAYQENTVFIMFTLSIITLLTSLFSIIGLLFTNKRILSCIFAFVAIVCVFVMWIM